MLSACGSRRSPPAVSARPRVEVEQDQPEASLEPLESARDRGAVNAKGAGRRGQRGQPADGEKDAQVGPVDATLRFCARRCENGQ
jgi:hypothetical protein